MGISQHIFWWLAWLFSLLAAPCLSLSLCVGLIYIREREREGEGKWQPRCVSAKERERIDCGAATFCETTRGYVQSDLYTAERQRKNRRIEVESSMMKPY